MSLGYVLLLVIVGPLIGYFLGRLMGKAASAPMIDSATELQKIADLKARKDADAIRADLLSRVHGDKQ